MHFFAGARYFLPVRDFFPVVRRFIGAGATFPALGGNFLGGTRDKNRVTDYVFLLVHNFFGETSGAILLASDANLLPSYPNLLPGDANRLTRDTNRFKTDSERYPSDFRDPALRCPSSFAWSDCEKNFPDRSPPTIPPYIRSGDSSHRRRACETR